MSTSIQLGQGANLLFGYRPAWNPTAGAPFFAPKEVSTETYEVPTPANPGTWVGTPVITLHATASDLISAVYKYKVAPMALDPAGIEVPVGALALSDADSAAAIAAESAFLGIDLTGQLKYMLVTMSRSSGLFKHPLVANPSASDRATYLTALAQAAIGKLKAAAPPKQGSVLYDSKLTKAAADDYVSALYELGTHFVSQVELGDRLIQVFGFSSEKFKTLETAFASDATQQPDGGMAVSGRTAYSWIYYTPPLNGSFGFVTSYGKLVCLSRDPALATSMQNPKTWQTGQTPANVASIFAGATDNRKLLPLTQQIPIALTLAPIANLISNLLVAGPWDHLVAGGLLQKYGDRVRIPLKRQLAYDWNTIFPQTADTFSANLVTPTIDLYQERIDLAKVELLGGSLVAANFPMKSFTSFSQVLQATTQPGDAAIALPSDNITLVAQILDTTQALQTPVLSMSANAFQQFSVFCEDMYGSLIFEDASTPGHRKVALDGFLFATSGVDPSTQRYTVKLDGVLSDAPDATVIAGLKQSIEFSIVAGESLLQARGANAQLVRDLEAAFLIWLAGLIPADTQDEDLANNRARALYLAHGVSTFDADLVFVPYVTYEAYRNYVSDMVEEASNLQGQILSYQGQITDTINSFKVLDSIANLNDNIKQIGGVLTQYFKALASGRGAMDGYYDSVIQQLDAELVQTLKDITELSKKLQAQQAVINQTGEPPGIVQRFQQDYADYSRDQIAQAVVDGVSGLFELGFAVFAIPEAAAGGILSALKAFKKVYDQLQAVMKVLAALEAVEKAAAGKVDKLNDLSNAIAQVAGQGTLQMPSQVDLMAMAQNVQAALANVPTTGKLNQDKADLVAAVNTLVILGTALIEAQTKASQIAIARANTYRRKTINGQQEANLAALVNGLHLNSSTRPPDISSIDLIGVSGQLQFQLKQVLLVLAQTLELQDGALQYEYFGQPTEITSFSLANLLSVISTQDQNILSGIAQLNPPPQLVPKPISVILKNIPASRLSGSNVFQLPIQLNRTEFYNYDMVRIERVVPSIQGIKSTDSGNYEIHLSCQAKPFQDRDYQRQARTFASVQRNFGPYVYNVATGAAEFGSGTGTFANQVTHLTPFSLWQISLPSDVANNQGIVFDDLLVDLQLDFYVTAHYDDPALRHQALVAAALAAPLPGSLALAAQNGDSPSLANLEAQMYQNQAVLQGWDAVFNVLEGPVNAFLYQQFQAYLAKLDPATSDNLMTIRAYYCEGVNNFQGNWFTNVTKLEFKLSNPLLQFVAGNDSVTVTQNILKGVITTGTVSVTENGFDPTACHLVDGNVNFTASPATGVLTLSVDGVFESNVQVKLSTTGTLPAPLQANTAYWIVNWASSGGRTTLQLSATAGGAPIPLTSSGSGTQTIALDIYWGNPVTADLSKHPYVLGSVALASISGIVTPPPGQGSASETHTVYLDFPSGSFTLRQFVVDPPNWDPTHHSTAISAALADFYANNDIKYQVQTINYTNLSQDAALQPTQFILNATNTNAGNSVLQIFIATTGKVQKAHTLNLNEPIPYDPENPIPGTSDFTVSLMVSTELMFEHIFVDSFNRGGTTITVAAVDPGKDFQAWSAKVTSGSAVGPANFADSYDVDGTKTQFRINASSNDIKWSLVDLVFQRSQSAGIDLYYTNGSANTDPATGGTTVSFQYRQWVPSQFIAPHGPTIPAHWSDWQDASAVAYITMNGNYPLEVVGQGTAQKVQFSTIEPTVVFSKASDLKPATGCQCNDNAIKIALLNSLGASVPATLKQYIAEITFEPISVFALETLLFPADQLLTLQQARVPGDLLVVGSFLAKVRKPSSSYNVTISAAAGAQGVFGATTFENGVGTGSAVQNALPKQFSFKYGPINPAIGGIVDYTIDIEKGTVSPPLLVVVDQPDPDNKPATVILLPPGFGPDAT